MDVKLMMMMSKTLIITIIWNNTNSIMDPKTSVIMRFSLCTSQECSFRTLYPSIKYFIIHLFHIAPLHSRDYSRNCWGRHIAHHWHNQSDIQLQTKMEYKKISARFVWGVGGSTPSGFFNPKVSIDPIWFSRKYSTDPILDSPQI